jgi:hypothetical protein
MNIDYLLLVTEQLIFVMGACYVFLEVQNTSYF